MRKTILILFIIFVMVLPVNCNYFGTNPGKWSGMGIGLYSTDNTATFDGYVDTLLAYGFTNLRVDIPDYQRDDIITRSKAAVIRAIAKGANIMWGVSSNDGNNALYEITAGNWATNVSSTVDSTADTTHFVDNALTEADDYYKGAYFYNVTRSLGSVIEDFVAETDTITLSTAITAMTAGDSYTIKGFHQSILDAATWAQANGVFEFLLGNEEEKHNDDDTMTDAQLRTNLRSVATEVQAIYTNGDVSYAFAAGNRANWISEGFGDMDKLGVNLYSGGSGSYDDYWKTQIDQLVAEFGSDVYVKEFSVSWTSLDDFSEDEAVQAAKITEMIDYIKASGITRADFYNWKPESFSPVKEDESYRLLWWSLLNSD